MAIAVKQSEKSKQTDIKVAESAARAVRTVEAVERFLHHEHEKYLAARAATGVPVPVAGA